MPLEPWEDDLVEQAIAARQMAYTPYSHFDVGAALLTGSGQVFSGANIENASYGLTVCAERVAVFKAVSSGQRDLLAIAVITGPGVAPCGACRQVLAEFNPDMIVVIADADGRTRRRYNLRQLLPETFGPNDLPPPAADA